MYTILRSAYALRVNLSFLFIRPHQHSATVDGIRAISVLWVILFHCFTAMAFFMAKEDYTAFCESTSLYFGWIWKGGLGVDCFFVISGFLITNLLLKEYEHSGRIHYRRFYWRRYLRLTPAYAVLILLYYFSGLPHASEVWKNALYINNFFDVETTPMPWTWSLAVEEQFYIVFPVILVFLMRTGKPLLWMLVGVLVSSLITAVLLATEPRLWNASYADVFHSAELMKLYLNRIYDELSCRFGNLLCGAIAAYLTRPSQIRRLEFLRRPRIHQAATFLCITVVSVFLFMPIYKPSAGFTPEFSRVFAVFEHNVFSAAVALFLVLSANPQGISLWIGKGLSLRFWYPLAQLSYSLYLIHFPVVWIVHALLKANLKANELTYFDIGIPGIFGVFMVVLFFSVILASILYLFVERPFMSLRDTRIFSRDEKDIELRPA